MTDALNLNDEMRAEIAKMAERFAVAPELILRRMVFGYAAKFEDQPQPDGTNVVPMRGEE